VQSLYRIVFSSGNAEVQTTETSVTITASVIDDASETEDALVVDCCDVCLL